MPPEAPMPVNADDLVAALKLQREVQATEAAMMAAACEGLKRRVATLEKELTELKADHPTVP